MKRPHKPNLNRFTRLTTIAPLAMVFSTAAWQSYWHIHELTKHHSTDNITPYLMPLSVDGLIIAAYRYTTPANSPATRALAYLSLAVGLVATLLANVAAAPDNPTARLLSAWPAVALTLTGLLLHKPARPRPNKQATRRTTAATTKPRTTPNSATINPATAPKTTTRRRRNANTAQPLPLPA